MDGNDFRKILTVGELTNLIAGLMEAAFPIVWVEGEISGLATPSSGHIYFTLKDDSAQIRVVVFKNQARTLGFAPGRNEPQSADEPSRALFSSARGNVPWRPADGMHVLVMGHIGVYAPRGEYQIIADVVEPVGAGAMMMALEQLKQRLSQKGYFSLERKRPLPPFPKTIAVVTSPTGAALYDIIRIVFSRMPASRVLVVPVRVQGEGSELEIARGIQTVNRLNLADVIIVGRGGGSIEDLWAFNTEVVADAIFVSTIPVVSAVGHEVDITIADLVADLRAPTPTAAAELVTPKLDDLLMTLDRLERRMSSGVRYLTAMHHRRLMSLAQQVRSPEQAIDRFRLRLNAAISGLKFGIGSRVNLRKTGLSSYTHALARLSPEAVLARGYSITQRADDGKIVRAPSDIEIGDKARIRLSRGIILATIQGKQSDETS